MRDHYNPIGREIFWTGFALGVASALVVLAAILAYAAMATP
jgi:hypothetical protein